MIHDIHIALFMLRNEGKLSAGEMNAEILSTLESLFIKGNGEALLDAVELCLNSGIPVPKWVVTGFTCAWTIRWASGRSRTLDDAFGIKRPKNWRQKRARKDFLTSLIWQSVVRYKRQYPGPIGVPLFECVAEEWNQQVESSPKESSLHDLKINSTDVQEAYYAITKTSENPVNLIDK